MNYNIGDIVKLKDSHLGKIAIITNSTKWLPVLYDVIICGEENKVYEIQEKDIVEKL